MWAPRPIRNAINRLYRTRAHSHRTWLHAPRLDGENAQLAVVTRASYLSSTAADDRSHPPTSHRYERALARPRYTQTEQPEAPCCAASALCGDGVGPRGRRARSRTLAPHHSLSVDCRMTAWPSVRNLGAASATATVATRPSFEVDPACRWPSVDLESRRSVSLDCCTRSELRSRHTVGVAICRRWSAARDFERRRSPRTLGLHADRAARVVSLAGGPQPRPRPHPLRCRSPPSIESPPRTHPRP
jgi:hypothetical protein